MRATIKLVIRTVPFAGSGMPPDSKKMLRASDTPSNGARAGNSGGGGDGAGSRTRSGQVTATEMIRRPSAAILPRRASSCSGVMLESILARAPASIEADSSSVKRLSTRKARVVALLG